MRRASSHLEQSVRRSPFPACHPAGRYAVAASGRASDTCVHSETLGVGTVEGTTGEVDVYQISTTLNEWRLAEVAQIGSGSYHRAEDAQALGAIYQTLDLRITTE